MSPIRGRVYWADVGYGEKPFLCVSNNARNDKLDSCLAVRMTTTSKPTLDTIVPLSAQDAPFVGSILCDDVVQIYADEIARDGGAISLRTMMRVETGIKAAFAVK